MELLEVKVAGGQPVYSDVMLRRKTLATILQVKKRAIPPSLQAKTIDVCLGYEMGPFWWKETFSLVRGSRLKRASSANRWETLPIDRSVHQECSSWRTSLFVVTTTRPFAVGGMQFFKGKPTYRLLP